MGYIIPNNKYDMIKINDRTNQQICQITGLKKTPIKKVLKKFGVRYNIVHQSVVDKFNMIVPEYNIKKEKKYSYMLSCFLNDLYDARISFNQIDRKYLEDHYEEFISTHLGYFIRKNNGDVEKAKLEHKIRQSTTSNSSFIKKYGLIEGTKKFNEHFNHIHKINSGNNHWLSKINVSFKEHISQTNGISNEEVADLFNHKTKWKSDGLTEEQINSRRTEIARYAASCHTDESLLKFKSSLSKTLSDMKANGTFYQKFGCWKVCYKYAHDNNIEYNDINRIKIWNLLFNVNTIEYWTNRGHDSESAKNQISMFMKPQSKTSMKILKEISKLFKFDIQYEYKFGPYKIDGYVDSKKLMIEYFGDYWHMNPLIYDSHHQIRGGKSAPKIWEDNEKRIEYLQCNGFNTFVIWEYDWCHNRKIVLEQLKNKINEL